MEALKERTGLTYEQELSDASKRQAMQLILDNGDQFDPEVVDGALNDLNSQMYDPLIPKEESSENPNNEVDPVKELEQTRDKEE